MNYTATLVAFLLTAAPFSAADKSTNSAPVEKGTVRFTPGDEAKVPAHYRLDARTFDYELSLKSDVPGSALTISRLRFPSAVESETPENNTVYAEYYRPRGEGPFPAVIVLDITAGNQSLSRTIATFLAQNKIAGLFVQMAYYGPRRPPGSKLRLMSPNIAHTKSAVRQTVLDLRLASAWLESRPELDPKRLGILGTSLGSFMAALTAEMEPRLGRVAVLLGGGGFVQGYYDHPYAAGFRVAFEALGGTRESLTKLIAPMDPLTCAENLKGRKVLIMAARKDEVVPPKMAKLLWQAAGQQQIVWFDAGHYSAILYLPLALGHIVKHFGAE